MSDKSDSVEQTTRSQRRRLLHLFGTAAALLPVSLIVGCADDQPAAPASNARAPEPERPARQDSTAATETTQQDVAQRADEPAPEPVEQATENAPETTTGPANEQAQKLSLDDPTAKALGYKHDAANVDLEKYPQRAAAGASNNLCRNCALYQGGEGEQWGPCTLFQGRLVNADGWCSAYAPKPA